jgi:membrane-bound ClpP family serine protease
MEIYDARSEIGFIDRGDPIIVIKDGTTQLYVVKDE